MAISFYGTQNALPADILPIGYTLPVIDAFQDFTYQYDLVISVDVDIRDTTAVNTMNNIISFLNEQVLIILQADFKSSAKVETYGKLTDISTRHTPSNNNTSMEYLLSATTNQYLLSVTIYARN
jgi:hypothetical protein